MGKGKNGLWLPKKLEPPERKECCYHKPLPSGKEYEILTSYPAWYHVRCCHCNGFNYAKGRFGCEREGFTTVVKYKKSRKI